MTLTIGYIGFGKSTTRYHLPYVLIRPNIKVKTIYYPDHDTAREAEYAPYGIQFTDDIKVLLNDPDIQLVSICTPPSSHFELAKACLEHGKNALVEKPFCPTKKEAEELMALAKEKGLVVMPYQNRRFDSDFLTMSAVLGSGALGDIVEIESHFDYFRPEAPTHPGSYFDGAFYGLGIHTLDQIVSLLGRPDAVSYDIRSVRNEENPDDTFEAQLFYGDKLKAIIKTSHLVKMDYPKFIVHGTKGSFIKYGIDQQETCLKAGIMPGSAAFGFDPVENFAKIDYIDDAGTEHQAVIQTMLGDYGRVYDSLYETIINGEPKLVEDEQLLTTMEILENGFVAASPHTVKFN